MQVIAVKDPAFEDKDAWRRTMDIQSKQCLTAHPGHWLDIIEALLNPLSQRVAFGHEA